MSAGVNVYKHYCEGAFEGVSVLVALEQCKHEESHKEHEESASSCCTETQEHKSCCNNKTEYISIDYDFIASDFEFQVPAILHTLLNLRFKGFNLTHKKSFLTYKVSEDPPPSSISIEGITQCFRL